MTIEKTFQGAYKISDLINGQLVTQQYMGYTKKQATEKFKAMAKEIKTNGI